MREDFLVIIDWQPHVVRAGIGMGEVIPRPTVELEARVALRRDGACSSSNVNVNGSTGTSTSTRKWSDYLVGQALEEAERSGEELDIVWPLQLGSSSSSSRDNKAVSSTTSSGDVAMTDDTAATSTSTNGKGKMAEAEGVKDWTALEALFRHLIITCLSLPSKPVNHMFLLAHPPSLSPSTLELVTQQFFEHHCVSNLLLVERSLVQLLSCNALSGIVVDVGRNFTDVSVVLDSQVVPYAHLRFDVGERDCDEYLEKILLERNPDLPRLLSAEDSRSTKEEADQQRVSRAIQTLIKIMKEGEYIRYSPAKASTSADPRATGENDEDEEEEEGISDVAKAIASGKVNKIINKDMAAGAAEGQEVRVIEQDEDEEEEAAKAEAGENGDEAMAGADGATADSAEAGTASKVAAASQTQKKPKGNKLSIPNPVSTSLPNIVIGNERNRYAEPLFDPSVLLAAASSRSADADAAEMQSAKEKAYGPSLGEVVNAAVMRIPEADKRAALWENVVVTGSMARVKGFAPALISSLHRYLPQSTNPLATTYNDSNQPQDAFRNRRARHLKTPEYFSEFRERPDLTSFLGGCIYAKFGFQESQGGEWLTKQHYNQHGPKIATMLPGSWEL